MSSTMRSPRDEAPLLRLGILGVVAVSLFATLFARLWFLQVLDAPEYELAAKRNQVRVLPIPPPRGRILDRNGEVLVENRASNVVAIDKAVLDPDDRKPLLQRLSGLLGVPFKELRENLKDEAASPYAPVPVADGVPDEVLVTLRERSGRFAAVRTSRVAVRQYNYETLAAHVLGYVGEINAEELAQRGGDYSLGDIIGRAGIERTYEDELRGTPGRLEVEVDADGTPVDVLSRRAPVEGHDVVLSIDLKAQQVAEERLVRRLEELRSTSQNPGEPTLVANAGSVVATDVTNGSVIAMASYPTFDPATLSDGFSVAEGQALFADTAGSPLTNRVTQGRYAPGSTWKLITAYAGLRTGLIRPTDVYNDTGRYRTPGCSSANCERTNARATPYGTVDLAQALTVSSDTYFYDMGARFWFEDTRNRLGPTPMQDAARELGFGLRTGVPLPAEEKGVVAEPTQADLNRLDNPGAGGGDGWFIGSNVNAAIGQGGIDVTPLQLANAYATFGNGGTRYRPSLALRVEDRRANRRPELVRTIEPQVAGTVAFPPEIRDPLREGFLGATQWEGDAGLRAGTAAGAFRGWPHAYFPVAGKTGTAQVGGGKQDTALFAAVASGPDGPKYAVTVVMEQSGFGSTGAAPVARSVLGTLFDVEAPDAVPPPSTGID